MKIDEEISKILDDLAIETLLAAQESVLANPTIDPNVLFMLAISYSYRLLIERMKPIAKLPVDMPKRKKASSN